MATRRQEDPPRLPSSPLMPEVGRDLAATLEIHFFLGLPFDESAQQLRVSTRVVKRNWSMARARLRQELSP
jgi:DNA-directed RNA polymerase specialized sigma24 family protein